MHLLGEHRRFEWFTQDEVRMTVIQTLLVVRVLNNGRALDKGLQDSCLFLVIQLLQTIDGK